MPNPTGEIVQVTPSAIAPGEPVTLYITYNAFHPGIIAAWMTRIKGTLNGFHGNNTNFHVWGAGNRIGEALYFNQAMPNHAISGTITLEYEPLGPAKPIALDSRRITINIPQQIEPITPKPPPETAPIFPGIPELPTLPEGLQKWMEEKTLGIKNKYLMYAGIGIAIAALLYFLVFRGKGRKK